MLYSYILKIYYFEEKFDVSQIAKGGRLDEEVEASVEIIKVKNLTELRKDVYLSYSDKHYLPEFCVYAGNKLHLHSRWLPFNHREVLKGKIVSLECALTQLLLQRYDGNLYYRKDFVSSKEKKILVFDVDSDIELGDDTVTVIPINNEHEIPRIITKQNFMEEYNESYLILRKHSVKVKKISKCHNSFHVLETNKLKQLIKVLKDSKEWQNDNEGIRNLVNN